MSEPPMAIEPAAPEPTLSVTMSRLVRSALPGRLAQLFHLGLPLAVQFAVLGWWRSAAWALAIAAFGSWGLSDRWLASDDSAHSSYRRLVRLACVAAATVASVVPFVLVLDLFFHILGAPPKS